MHDSGLRNLEAVHPNLSAARLIELAVRRGEGQLAANGALAVETGQFTGRSPKDKYIVRAASTESTVHWGPVNQELTSDQFARLYAKVQAYLQGREVFIQDCFGGTDPVYRLPVRVISQLAWHSLFARQLFVRATAEELKSHHPEFRLIFAPGFQADPAEDGTRTETCIALDFDRRVVLILGTYYAGEMKKSVFTILNYLLPDRGVMPMHCSANTAGDGRSSLFFGLSGTGKTTLSADPTRQLIGDDEHGWSERGIFNFEGGCYAKCIRLSKEGEPQIWNAIRYGSVLENVVVDPITRECDYDSNAKTENTRVAYPVEFIDNAVIPGAGGHPNHVIFLTADAFGVLPPLAKLTPEQAMYHFLSGYTAKVAGTERGLGSEPEPNFSACFGAPFLPRAPRVYAAMLGEKLRKHGAQVWLVNTGWTGGPYGVGSRMKLAYTRAMLNAAISGRLADVPVEPHPVFKVLVPKSCPDVPAEVLDARGQWADKAAYDRAAADLAGKFNANFRKFEAVDEEVLQAAPAMA